MANKDIKKLENEFKQLALTLQRVMNIAEEQRKARSEIELRLNFALKNLETLIGADSIATRWAEFVKTNRGIIDPNGIMDGTLDVNRYGV